jgi:hypothetical protein
MATYTAGTTPVQIVRGRPFSLPMTWQTAAIPPVAINITAYTLAGSVVWTQADGDAGTSEAQDLAFTVTDAVNGLFMATLDSNATLALPDAATGQIGVTLTDGSGNTYDFDIPGLVATPVGVD